MEIYDNFVFYGSFRNTIDKLPEDLRGKFALAIINYGTAGEIDDSDDYISAIMPLVIPNINASQERQVKNTIKGKEGGRPVEVNRETVIQLKKQGLTQMSIAVEMKCDVSTVKRILRESDIPDGIGAKGVITSHNQEEDKDKEEEKEEDKEQEQDTKINSKEKIDTDNVLDTSVASIFSTLPVNPVSSQLVTNVSFSDLFDLFGNIPEKYYDERKKKLINNLNTIYGAQLSDIEINTFLQNMYHCKKNDLIHESKYHTDNGYCFAVANHFKNKDLLHSYLELTEQGQVKQHKQETAVINSENNITLFPTGRNEVEPEENDEFEDLMPF